MIKELEFIHKMEYENVAKLTMSKGIIPVGQTKLMQKIWK